MPYHGRIHLNNILLHRLDTPGQQIVAAISDTYLQTTIDIADKLLTDKFGPGLASTSSSTFSNRGYIAPELFGANATCGSQPGDVWAFGFTVLHVCSPPISFFFKR